MGTSFRVIDLLNGRALLGRKVNYLNIEYTVTGTNANQRQTQLELTAPDGSVVHPAVTVILTRMVIYSNPGEIAWKIVSTSPTGIHACTTTANKTFHHFQENDKVHLDPPPKLIPAQTRHTPD